MQATCVRAGRTIRIALGIVWLLLGYVSAVPAQSKGNMPLDIQCDRLYAVRSESPISLRVQMTPLGSSLVEGRLEFKLWNGNDLLSTTVSDDEVINPPMKIARYVLPAPELKGYGQQLEITIEFVTSSTRTKYGPYPILVPKARTRDFIVGQIAPEASRSAPSIDAIFDRLKLESLSPVTEDLSVRTLVSRVNPDQLPADPLGYCNFNILVAAGEGFAAIKESQWPNILEWVEAGGSLCVIPTDGLAAHHQAVLNQLMAQKSTDGLFVAGPNGEVLLKNEQERKPLYLARRGVGVVAIVPVLDTKTGPELSHQEWTSLVAHLWRIRLEQLASLQTTGKWSRTTQEEQLRVLQSRGFGNYYHIRSQDTPLSYVPLNSGDQMIQSIIPSSLHIIPLSLIAFVLFLYVLAIGPGDYFILGRLKMRKWTWVTFPVTTLLFAGGALWMAEWYMNTGDARRSAYLVDVGVEGNLERVNQFEMLFNSRQKITETNLSKSLFTPLDHQMYGSGSYQQYNQRLVGYGSGFVGPPEVSGRIPTRFVARQLTPKWVPQLNRIFSLNTEAFQLKLDWNQFRVSQPTDWALQLGDTNWKQSIVTAVKAAVGSKPVVIQVHTGGKTHQLYGNHRIFTREQVDLQSGQPVAVPAANAQRFDPSFQGYGADFITDVSALNDAGLFAVVSSIAPHGGRQLEDLSLLDTSDPSQWLLVVAVEDGENWVVYRKLYAGNP